VLPDAAEIPADVLSGAGDRLWLAGYTLTSERITDGLVAAKRRGVDVRVLVEGEPIGGRTRGGAERLDRLTDAGVEVRAIGGPYARYDVHHAKYALVDDRAIVLTENWKPAGTGGNSSRGWGVVTDQPTVVANLSATFDADAGWRDARPWATYRAGRTFDPGERSTGTYPSTHEPARVDVTGTELLVTPDNARERLLAVLADAEASIDVVQVSIGGWNDPFAVSLRRAARRGVEVRLLLSSAWYVHEDNAALVDRFEEWADRTGAPLSVRLAESGERFEKIHAKGAVVDDSVVVGSLNWNEHAATNNREVLAVLHCDEAAAYYRSVFEADWDGRGGSALPLGVLVGAGGAVALAAAVIARVKFEGPR
jgi:phosphatidylserine/phosphatidylglycerophosphate/cardiolipin synthase-like enzyme